MKNVLIILTSIFSLNALSQNQPVFRQWYAIPGLYNPALVGDDHARNISVLHRRQWTSPGIGPEATGLLFQHAGNHRLDYGVSLTTNTVVRLTNSDARFILAYGIPLGPMTFLRFGMSGGLAVRKLDLGNDDYSNDPAVLRAADGLYGFSGSAGLSFQRGGFQLAASLPAVLPQESYSPAKLAAVENSQLLSQWYTVRYRIRPQGSNIEVDPWAVYRVLRDQRRNWEAGGLVTFKKAFSLGLSWNSTLGAAVITGFRFSGVEAGYTWEPGTGAANPFGGSHELRVTVKVGQHTGGRARKSTVGENGKSSGPAVEVSNTPLSSGYYLVAGRYKTKEEARQKVQELQDRVTGSAGLGWDKSGEVFLVYLAKSRKKSAVKQSFARNRGKAGMEDLIILLVP